MEQSPHTGCGLRTDLGELHYPLAGDQDRLRCGLRTDLGELHLLLTGRIIRRLLWIADRPW